jgi:hypothetical protein
MVAVLLVLVAGVTHATSGRSVQDEPEVGSSSRYLQCWQPEPPAPRQDSSGKLPPHPRLRVNDNHLATLNHTIHTDATAMAYFEGLHAFGKSWLTAPLVDCTASHMSNTQSRTTLTIQYTLGLLWRLTGDKRFAARATEELLHVTTNYPITC